jgi:hypothetical protein
MLGTRNNVTFTDDMLALMSFYPIHASPIVLFPLDF